VSQNFLHIARRPSAHIESSTSDLAANSRSCTLKQAFNFAKKVPLTSFGASYSPGEVHLEARDFSLVAVAFYS
jgi:hypothetical protein